MKMTRHELYQQFQHEFPIETLRDMPLEKYTNLNKKDSFCYWLESETFKLGSIWGGNSFKYGIYRFEKNPGVMKGVKHDDEYAWNPSLGDNAQEAYKKVLEGVCSIADYARKGYYDQIDDIDVVWPIVRWKIAFMYSEEKLIPVYEKKMLVSLAKHLGMKDANKNTPHYELYKFLLDKKGDKDLYSFYDELLEVDKEVKEQEEKKEMADNRHYWWIVAKPKIWSLSNMKIGEEQTYTLYNDNGNQRRIFQNFTNTRKGDVVIGYEATPEKKIVAICEISHDADDKYIYIKKKESLGTPIDFSTIKEDPDLQDMEFFKNMNGSLFKLTKDEYETIMDLIREENPLPEKHEYKKYDKEDFLNEVFMSEADYDKLKALLLSKKNVILEGAPGVGKTFTANRLAYSIMGEEDKSRVALVQFHQNYSYEDFMMGYKPDENGGFSLKKGIFYTFCKAAQDNPDKPYFFIIDEINRGNLSKIFGELLMLIENSYRGHEIRLAYNDELFSVPNNLYIIGMMNTADRSLAMIDYALRRRFSFFDMEPGFDTKGFKQYQSKVIGNPIFDKVIDGIKNLNKTIEQDDSLGKGFCIGHSYFCNQKSFDKQWLDNVIEYDVIPMLREYWFDDTSKFKAEAQKLENLLK